AHTSRWAWLALLGVAIPVAARQPPSDLHAASGDTRRLATWVAASGDNHGLPFVIVDKVTATVFVFGADGTIRGAAPALLGLAHSDDQVAGIGTRQLKTIRPAERTTPAGRFEASLGSDLTQDLLWVDYAGALSLHRVVVGNPADRRHARLASPTPRDNRISYGCINVPAPFYDGVVAPAFKGTVGIVYILPETRPIEAVFPMMPPPQQGKPHPVSVR
ncbi:L,D-transpeptidase, partial [Sphingomonas sp. HMWF008]